MNRITLALAFFYLPTSADGLCSASTCEELGWFETQAGTHGSPHVCGESDVATGCPGEMNNANAEIFCEKHGARLCTLPELEQDETKRTGCGYDKVLVWSATSCDSGAGFMAVHGAQKFASAAVCTSAQESSTVVARCCADAESVVNDPVMCPPIGPKTGTNTGSETDSDTGLYTGSCFHGNGTVLLESGASKRLSEVNIGDRIKTSDDKGGFSFSLVATLPHKKNTELAAFLTLTTETKKAVDMTSDHFIPKCDKEIVTAGKLVVGDCVLTIDGKETLIDITTTEKSGVYTAVTENKFIVVDGVVASPYSSSSKDQGPQEVYEKYREELELMRSTGFASKARKRLRGSLTSPHP